MLKIFIIHNIKPKDNIKKAKRVIDTPHTKLFMD